MPVTFLVKRKHHTIQKKRFYVLPGVPQNRITPKMKVSTYFEPANQQMLIHRVHIASQHDEPKLSGPLILDATFYLPTPRKNLELRHQMEDCYHATNPTIYKLLGYLEDLIVGNIIAHGGFIVQAIATKAYAYEPRTEFTLTSLKGA